MKKIKFSWKQFEAFIEFLRRAFAPPANTGDGDSSSPTPVNPAPPLPDAGGANGDDLDLSQIVPVRNWPKKVSAKIRSASMSNDEIVTSYEPYSWPVKIVGAECDAVAHLFYEQDGKIVGGKFDWWRKGGQSVKGLENVHAGYGGHKMPQRGTKVWTMISSVDGKQRSNTCAVTWR